MTVIVKYVVERNGVEKMMSTSKKEADVYDKMLDVADNLSDFIGASPVAIDERIAEELSLYLAQNSLLLQQILKGGKVKSPTDEVSVNELKMKKVSPNTDDKKVA